MIVLFEQAKSAGVALQLGPGLGPVRITDLDRAKAYYVDVLGFEEDADLRPGAGVRVVRLKRPGVSGSLLLAARSSER